MLGTGWRVLAAPINYGTQAGTDMIFGDVTEDTSSGDSPPLFGAPGVTGNSIDFNPVGFDAASQNVGDDTTAGDLSFTLTAKPGSWIQSLTFSAAGDTTMAGNVAPGSTDTAAAVVAAGTIEIHEANFVALNPVISVAFALSFAPSGGTYFLGTDGGGGPVFHTQWAGSVTIPVETILIANGIDVGATRVVIDLDHTLTASSQAGTSVQIDMKDFGAVVVRADVPEPGSLVGVAGLAVLAFRRRGRVRSDVDAG